jgi:amino acid adenylation domain-containing protein
MNAPHAVGFRCSPSQAEIQARCVHPYGHFVPFSKDRINSSISELFEQQVVNHPERIAVSSESQILTYNELNRLADRVAHEVLARCGETHRPIGLLVERTGDAIAVMLGLLKAGKIFVPLDPGYPLSKLTAVLKDCHCEMLLIDGLNLPLSRQLTVGRCPVLCLDEVDAAQPSLDIRLPRPAHSFAAIFYTSGSSGLPKGVIQSQQTILHRVMIDTNTFHICADDRLSLLSSMTYSVSLRNIFGALLNGAALCHFDIERQGLGQLPGWLSREKISIYFSVPAVFRRLMENLAGDQDLAAVRLIYLAGEGATKGDVELYKRHFSRECIFVNSLASNEAGIIRQYFADKSTEIDETLVPVGYEVDDKQIVLLDDGGEEVACDQVGEIYVRSSHLSPGYWQNPDLTNAMFQTDPQRTGQRIYRTGDLGCMLQDGCLFYLGRNDARVKIRGMGVEIAEIEMTLLEHNALKEAVVIVRDDSRAEKQLVAYLVVREPELRPTPKEMRAFLQQKLPDHMIPSRFVFSESLPLTPNGKVDRQALLLLERVGNLGVETFLAARNPVEKELTEIWCEVLGLNRVGIHDNFFDLGGHSLSASQVVARVQNRFHLDIPLAVVFMNPTIAEMAQMIAEYQQESESDAYE